MEARCTNMLRFSELTQEQKAFICNGCGGKGGIVNPLEFLFHASSGKTFEEVSAEYLYGKVLAHLSK